MQTGKKVSEIFEMLIKKNSWEKKNKQYANIWNNFTENKHI